MNKLGISVGIVQVITGILMDLLAYIFPLPSLYSIALFVIGGIAIISGVVLIREGSR